MTESRVSKKPEMSCSTIVDSRERLHVLALVEIVPS